MKYLLIWISLILLAGAGCSPKINEGTDPGDNTSATAPSEAETEVEGNQTERWARKSREGIDFLATGNELFWSVEIDFDGDMVFTTPEAGPMMSVPAPDPVRPQDARAVSYRADTDSGNLYVTIFREDCTDTMSGLESPYKVNVSVRTPDSDVYEEVTGCGRYISDYRLHDIWALVEMDGKTVRTEDFTRRVPTMELQLTQGKVFGHGGCNRITGSVILGRGELIFGNLASTKMACPQMSFESQYLEALSGNTLSYKLDGLRLKLEGNGHQLTFKKVD